MEGRVCFLCHSPASIQCDQCSNYSCSPAHLKTHQSGTHGCLPIAMVYKEGVGTCCVATRDIKPGHTVMVDTPAVWGPNNNTAPQCVNCLVTWTGDSVCAQCGYPVCGQECGEGEQHRVECGVLASLDRQTFRPGDKTCPAITLVNVIRLLHLADRDHELAERVTVLMDHVEDIAEDQDLKENVIDPLTKKLPNSPYSSESVWHALGVLLTNCVAIWIPGYSQSHALYPTFSYVSHSCLCNSRFQVLPDRSLVLRAQVLIKEGEEITIHYTSPTLGTVPRRKKLRQHWFFDCTCMRCGDPTELATFSSGLVCRSCLAQNKSGTLLPLNSLDSGSVWTCAEENCQMQVSAKTVSCLMSAVRAEIEDTDQLSCEDLSKWLTVLHPNHYLIMGIKIKLLAALHLQTTTHPHPTRDIITHTIQLAEEILAVNEVLDPGLTFLKGRMLQFINRPKLMLANMDLAAGIISKEEFLFATAEAFRNIQMASKCFEENMIGYFGKEGE